MWRRQIVLCGSVDCQLVENMDLQGLTNEGPLVAIDWMGMLSRFSASHSLVAQLNITYEGY